MFLVPPMINEMTSTPPIVNVLPGDQFKLDCNVEGSPQPTVMLFKLNNFKLNGLKILD